jgi:hypothetical protein
VELVKVLLTHERTDPSARSNEALQTAMSAEIIELLVKDVRVVDKINEQVDNKQ